MLRGIDCWRGSLVVAAFYLATIAADSQTAPTAGANQSMVKPREVRKVYGDGNHNAFTALARFRDRYFLAFRTAKAHNSTDGDILVLTSQDTRIWTESIRLDAAPDDRDPQFLKTDARLFLYDAAMRGGELTAMALYTDDGTTWSKPKAVYKPQFNIWKPCVFGGRFYATSHKKDEVSNGKDREVDLITSADGLSWQQVSVIRAGNWESETTLHFGGDGQLTAFLRQKYGSPQSQILEAAPPYTRWTARSSGISHLSGHSVHTFRGVTYVFTRTKDPATGKFGTMIYIYANGTFTPYCALPADGDCSYPEAIETGDDMLVSYYSSHEGPANIYLAVVPLK